MAVPAAPPSAPAREDRIWLPPAPPRPQAMLFTLWGDYVQPHGGEIWVGSLVRLAAQLGHSEAALRAVLTRMGRAGWLESERRGKRSVYRLSRRGRSVIKEGTARIFRRRRSADAWDGEWQVVAYSVPEARRKQRDAFRKRLAYLGFGPIGSGGTWISPHDLGADVDELAQELGVEGYVEQFRGRYGHPEQARQLAARVWPLHRLDAAYRPFLARWRSVEAAVEKRGGAISDAQAFTMRFWLIHEYQVFPREDPDLPPELVPPDWPGYEAAALFDTLHARLAQAAERFYEAEGTKY